MRRNPRVPVASCRVDGKLRSEPVPARVEVLTATLELERVQKLPHQAVTGHFRPFQVRAKAREPRDHAPSRVRLRLIAVLEPTPATRPHGRSESRVNHALTPASAWRTRPRVRPIPRPWCSSAAGARSGGSRTLASRDGRRSSRRPTEQRLSVRVAAWWKRLEGWWPAMARPRVRLYSSPAEALAAVSLSEYAMSHQNVGVVRRARRLQPRHFVPTVNITSPDCEGERSPATGRTGDSR